MNFPLNAVVSRLYVRLADDLVEPIVSAIILAHVHGWLSGEGMLIAVANALIAAEVAEC